MTRRGEFQLIHELFATLVGDSPAALGLKDDAALFRVEPGREMVATTDVLVGGVHFRMEDPPDLIGRKVLRVSLSDLASMGAEPRHYLLSAVLPTRIGDDWLEEFVAGLGRDQEEFGIQLVGGDTVTTSGPSVFSLTALGDVPAGEALLRSGAVEGDDVWVSGTVGDAALGLRADEDGFPTLSEADLDFLRDRYLLPRPRVRLGRELRGLASSCIDVSDGLVADLSHICDESGVGSEISFDQVPLSDPADQAVAADQNLIKAVLGGGDDYELLFTATPDHRGQIEAAAAADTAVARIGTMTGDRDIAVRRPDGSEISIPRRGYTHF